MDYRGWWRMTISKAQVNHIIWCVVDETEVSYADSEFESINVPESSREELITHILDVVNNDLEVCPKCYNLIKEEDYETEFESRIGYGGNEVITTGFTCSSCGYTDDL